MSWSSDGRSGDHRHATTVRSRRSWEIAECWSFRTPRLPWYAHFARAHLFFLTTCLRVVEEMLGPVWISGLRLSSFGSGYNMLRFRGTFHCYAFRYSRRFSSHSWCE